MAISEESSGTTKAALTLGTVGTVLGGLWALGGGSGNGLLSGLAGNNNTANMAGMAYVDQLQAKISELTAEKYSDKVGLEVYKTARQHDAVLNAKFEEMAKEISDMKVREATLKGDIATSHATISGQIAQVASTATNGISVLTSALNSLQSTVAGITKTIVPATAVCPAPMPQFNSWTAPTTTTTSAG